MSTDTQTIKDRIDAAQFIGEYVQLKKAGANYKGRCPFHNEKSPSFMVHPERQFWHCFGCGKGGDIFTFLQEVEGLEFPEALKILAERAGVKLDTYRGEIDKSQKNRLLEVNNAAANFFHQFLLQIPAAKSARDYLERRQIKSETIADWKIGYVTDQWDLLTKYLLKKNFTIDDLVASGLTIKKDGATAGHGFYDRFRGRVMFPIWDVHGNVVGFTGRILVEKENSGGKYVNTPQSLVYDKSRVLYGLNKAKQEIRRQDLAVIVEGQMDVVACHQAGMKNVIASSGTALTHDQVRLIKRYTTNITMAFDADAAGQEAAKRGISIAVEEGMSVRVIRIPDGAGKDADECLKKNPAVWFDAVKNAQEVMAWYFEGVLKNIDQRDARQKQKAADILLAEIARIPYAVERDEWIKRLGDELGIVAEVLRDSLKKVDKNKPQSNHNNSFAPEKMIEKAAEGRLEVLSRALWSLIAKFPQIFNHIQNVLKSEYFANSHWSSLYESCLKQYNTNGSVDIDNMRADVHGTGENLVDILLLSADKDYSDLNGAAASKEVANLTNQIKIEWAHQRRAQLQTEISAAERAGDKVRMIAILKELQELL